MYKKLLMACMALSAFVALAVAPASALAVNDPLVTSEGSKLEVSHASPISIVAKNTENLLMTDAEGNVLTNCTTATMSGDLETNTGTGSGTGTVEGTITTAAFSGSGTNGECTSTFGGITVTTNPATNGLPWCLRSTTTMATDEFQVRGNGCTSASRAIRFVLDSTTIGECIYQRSTAIPGTYTTGGTAVLSISKVEFTRQTGSSLLCPEKGFLDLKFSLETGAGKPVSIINQ